MAELNLSLKKTISEEAVRKLLEQADWGQGRKNTEVAQQIHSSDAVFSVWDATKLVGFARVLTDYSYVATVWDFIVAKEYQGKGVGSRLLKAILGYPDMIGVRKWAVFSPVNADFFEQHNFEKTDECLIRYG